MWRHQTKTHFPRYLLFATGIHQSPVNTPNKGQWRRTLLFSLICVWTNGWANHRDTSNLRCHRAHYDVIVMNPSNFDENLCNFVATTLSADDQIQIRYVYQTHRNWIKKCLIVTVQEWFLIQAKIAYIIEYSFLDKDCLLRPDKNDDILQWSWFSWWSEAPWFIFLSENLW